MKLIMDICFSVPVTKESSKYRKAVKSGRGIFYCLEREWPSGSECRKAIMERLTSLSDDELEEAVGFVDTEE